ncbi:MAG: hypothetical protein ACI841_005023 [Planctomycetota bacterium]|jgi:hypothetical protein
MIVGALAPLRFLRTVVDFLALAREPDDFLEERFELDLAEGRV